MMNPNEIPNNHSNTNPNQFDGLTLLKKSETRYPQHPDETKLEVFKNRYPHRCYFITFHCPEFTSVCPVTGQPDFGKITIRYIPSTYCIESKSLKLYLFAYRNFPTFHEDAVNKILEDVVQACQPHWCDVHGRFRPRGGIALEIRAQYCEPGFQPPNE